MISLEVADLGSHMRMTFVDKVRVPELGDLRTAAIAVATANKDVEVDLQRSEHLHAGVLQILMSLETAVVAAGHRFHVTATSPEASSALALSGLSTWMETS